MRASYYDVIILGAELPPLLCGALLAKRGFRVLLLGQQTPSPEYRVGPFKLPRRPFTYTAHRSPISRRVVTELGLAQSVRRMALRPRPAFQLSLAGHRLDVGREGSPFEREIEREFPEVKRPILEFHRLAMEHAAITDRLFEADLAWPPESFLDRRELQALSRQLPFDRDGQRRDLLTELPEEQPFRRAIGSLVSFGSNGDPAAINPLQLCRLYAARYDAAVLDGGLAALHELLIERIRSHSGDVRLGERAHEITVRRSAASGVRLFGSDEEIGGSFVVSGVDVSALLRLLPDRDPLEQLFERVGEPQPRFYRYALNLVLDAAGAPEGMARDVFHLARGGRRSGRPDQPLHLQLSALSSEQRLIAVETLLPARTVEEQGGQLEGVREHVLSAATELVPFLRQHLLLVDSPHDGRPPEALRSGVDTTLRGRERGPRTMPVVCAYPVTKALGICAMPIRTPLRGLLLCSNQNAPWLGIEGQMLAARSAARTVSRADRKKSWMRRRLWTKVEI